MIRRDKLFLFSHRKHKVDPLEYIQRRVTVAVIERVVNLKLVCNLRL